MSAAASYIFVVFLGLIFGSFATALIYRVPRGIAWWGRARSACTHCKKNLEARDLVPVFSWLLLRGKCRYCRAPVGRVYIFTELLTLLACIGVYAAWGLTLPGLIIMLCVPFLVALLVIDLEHMILPDQLVLIVAALALARLAAAYYLGVAGLDTILFDHVAGGFVYGAAAWVLGLAAGRVLKKDALGFGDVKFFAAAGLWLGVMQFGLFCLSAGVLGVGLGLGWKIAGKGAVFPFGPALIFSLYLLLII